MAKEIERKFLVKDIPFIIEGKESYLIEQYYISINPEIRLRKVLKDNQIKYYMTQKSNGAGIREEIETEVDETSYLNNQKRMIGQIIRKIRTCIPLENNLVAELDVYQNLDLQIVEVEFKDESESNKFIPPQWFGEEVTNDERYKNKNLAIKGKM